MSFKKLTLNRMTLNEIIFSTLTFNRLTFSIVTLNRMTFSRMTLSNQGEGGSKSHLSKKKKLKELFHQILFELIP